MTADDIQRRRSRLDRLRKLGLHRGAGQVQPAARPHPAPAATLDPAPRGSVGSADETALPGFEVETPFGPAWLREERYPLARHPELAAWLAVDPSALAALDRNDVLHRMDPATAAFVDTETTGLSLGAGTYTFLIGIGVFESDAVSNDFVVRQFFMRHPGEERAQLHLVEELLGRCTGIVSFNGRSFDMPLINNRFMLAEMPPPLPGAPHLDLLPPARRLYRLRWGACNLGALEHNVLELARTTEDVPGYLIPDIYRQYYLTGAATDMLARVFYHNLQDVVSMALLGSRMARYFRPHDLPSFMEELHPLECLSLGRCYDALQWTDAEIVIYRAVVAAAPGPTHQAAALRELALLHKRLEQRAEAAALWEESISTAPHDDLTPYIELAKYHEWHTGDLAAARGWAGWALNIAQKQPPGFARDQWTAELQHRLARIESKLAQTR